MAKMFLRYYFPVKPRSLCLLIFDAEADRCKDKDFCFMILYHSHTEYSTRHHPGGCILLSPLLTFRYLLFFDRISLFSLYLRKRLSPLLLTWLVPFRALCHSRRGKEEVEVFLFCVGSCSMGLNYPS